MTSGPYSDGVLAGESAGAFCRENHIALPGRSEGPLARLTFGAKDIFDIAGVRTGFGNPTWLETHDPAQTTAPAVQRLLDAGASMVGKTLTDEMAYSLTGENVHYGTPLNPNDPNRIPGGSSNGSVSAVAARLVDFALGTDCGGSVRLPASYCGVLGIRPSLGRVCLDNVIPFSASFDVVGWFARDAETLARVGSVVFDEPRPSRDATQLLIAEDAFGFVDGAVTKALQPGLARMTDHLATCERIRICDERLEDWFAVFRLIQASEIWANHGAWIVKHDPALGPGIRERMDWASKVSQDDVISARKRHRDIAQRLNERLGETDVLCVPTSPRIAPLRSAPVDDVEVRFRHQAMCVLCISGLGGLPQISLPLGVLDGMPLGLSLIARQGNDEMLLELAQAIMA